MDLLRRAQGDTFGALGLGPNECPYRVAASGSHWRLRDYTDQDTSPCFDCCGAYQTTVHLGSCSSVSAIRYCLRRRLHVYLLEWMPASRDNSSNGLDEYMRPSGNVFQKSRTRRRDKAFHHWPLTRRHAGSYIRRFGDLEASAVSCSSARPFVSSRRRANSATL